jgi:predicted ATPase
MNRLTSIEIHGFKSIRELKDFPLDALTVLVGANGAGKSNFVGFFRALSHLSSQHLQTYLLEDVGGANATLFDGAAVTRSIGACLTFKTVAGVNQYRFSLSHGAGDVLYFDDEAFRFLSAAKGDIADAQWTTLGQGNRESELGPHAARVKAHGKKTAGVIHSLLRNCRVYQFHNTSGTARIKARWNVEDNHLLREDGANLSAFLLRMRIHELAYYHRIVNTVRLIAPFFDDFVLEPIEGSILLQWRERGTDLLFNASQASDGMLRMIALVTLLLQPPKGLPWVLILDEPELGLHPMGLDVIAGLVRSTSLSRQVIVATQSPRFVDAFKPEEIVVVERRGRESLFRRLDPEPLKEWLEEYSTGELWEKGVIGGRPS